MKGKALALISILAGVACALAVFAYTNAIRTQADAARTEALARYGGETVEVCVATRDLAPGEVIDSSNTEQRSWLVDLLPAGAVESPESMNGRELSSSVVAGEVLSERRFEGEAAGVTVPEGMEAVTVEVSSAQAVGGALNAGARVEVYAIGVQQVTPIIESAQVLACGSGTSSRSWVTLAVAPMQAQELIATAQGGGLYLTLPSEEGRG